MLPERWWVPREMDDSSLFLLFVQLRRNYIFCLVVVVGDGGVD